MAKVAKEEHHKEQQHLVEEEAEKDKLPAEAVKAAKEWEEQIAELEWVNLKVHAIFGIWNSVLMTHAGWALG